MWKRKGTKSEKTHRVRVRQNRILNLKSSTRKRVVPFSRRAHAGEELQSDVEVFTQGRRWGTVLGAPEELSTNTHVQSSPLSFRHNWSGVAYQAGLHEQTHSGTEGFDLCSCRSWVGRL